MKHNIRKKIILNLTLDSSETVLFNKGGMHKINLNTGCLQFHDSEGDSEPAELEITVQIERSQQGRHDFLASSPGVNFGSRNES